MVIPSINFLIIADLLINLFFHIIQLRNYCYLHCNNEIRDSIVRLHRSIERIDGSFVEGHRKLHEAVEGIKGLQGNEC